mgnify:CR=1 FL=1
MSFADVVPQYALQVAEDLVRNGARVCGHFTGQHLLAPQLDRAADSGLWHVGQVDAEHVHRYTANQLGALAGDSRPTGRLRLPVLTLHAINDPTAFVELDAHFKTLMQQAGTADNLVQTFVSAAESHSYISDAVYVTLLSSLTQWASTGTKNRFKICVMMSTATALMRA